MWGGLIQVLWSVVTPVDVVMQSAPWNERNVRRTTAESPETRGPRAGTGEW